MSTLDMTEFHWMMDMLQSIDAGLVVLDRQHRIQLWNGFMENHSGRRPHEVRNQSLFDLFPDLPEDWFKRKLESVFLLKNRAFTTWEQRPYLFRFNSYRPITGSAEFMYQNITLMPLCALDGTVSHVCIIVYDVTNTAVNKLALEQANAELERLSRTDHLTGLNNRGYWEDCLIREFRRYSRTLQTSALVMFDIDHFKRINDTHGHPAGDEVIRQVAHALSSQLRETDCAGRYGGEEFAALLVGANAEGAVRFAERLRQRIEGLHIWHGNQHIQVTVSLGVSVATPELESHETWLAQTDEALYTSKQEGRNRVTLYESPED